MPVILFGSCSVGGNGYSIDPVNNINFNFGNGQVTINWTDPENTVIGGNMVAEWAGTVVVRNTDHYPENVKDGVKVVDSKVKNQYQTNGFVDTVENGVTYYYAIFAYSKKVYSVPVRESGTPKAVSKVLAENSWDVISAISESGQASQYWNIGDEINVQIAGGTYTFQIYGFNHDDKSDGSGKAGITFGMKHLLADIKRMNSSDTNNGSWNSTEMRNTTLAGYWNTMQSDVKAVVKTVNKKTASSYSSGSSLQTTADNLFLFAEKEVGFSSYSVNTERNALSTYPIFTNDTSRIKKLNNGTGSANYWWLRSPYYGYSSYFCIVLDDGYEDANKASIWRGVALGFCV